MRRFAFANHWWLDGDMVEPPQVDGGHGGAAPEDLEEMQLDLPCGCRRANRTWLSLRKRWDGGWV